MRFIDLAAQQYRIRDKIENRMKKVLDHGQYIMGPEISELEEKLADYVGVQHAVGVGSGTDALLIPLMAYGIEQGDAVFTTTFTFIATAEVIQILRATPVFVDIDPKTFNIDPDKLERSINEVIKEGKLKPRGIIPVDLFGQPAEYDEINEIAKKHNLFVLEDAAQSFGATYKGNKACSLADIAAASFFPSKPLGCYGDGGMIFTDNTELYENLVSIRVHGQGSDKYDNIRNGINGRMDTIQAAILLAKFEIFDEEIQLRQEVAKRYNKALKDILKLSYVNHHSISSWAQYSVLHPDRDKIIKKLKENDIPAAIYYSKPLHLQKAFFNLEYHKGHFPAAEHIAARIFSLPLYPYLTEEDQNLIISSIKSIIKSAC